MNVTLVKDCRYMLTLTVMPPSGVPAVTTALHAQGFSRFAGGSPLPGDAPVLHALYRGASGDKDLANVTACVVVPDDDA